MEKHKTDLLISTRNDGVEIILDGVREFEINEKELIIKDENRIKYWPYEYSTLKIEFYDGEEKIVIFGNYNNGRTLGNDICIAIF